MRHPMRLEMPWRLLLPLFGGVRGRSYVEVTPASVRFRFGWLFDETVQRGEIERAERGSWPWFYGIGWRIAPGGRIGLIGSLRGVVETTLREPHWVRLGFIPWRTRRVFVSLEHPEAFLDDLGSSAAAGDDRTP